jgi:hypothetical protein
VSGAVGFDGAHCATTFHVFGFGLESAAVAICALVKPTCATSDPTKVEAFVADVGKDVRHEKAYQSFAFRFGYVTGLGGVFVTAWSCVNVPAPEASVGVDTPAGAVQSPVPTQALVFVGSPKTLMFEKPAAVSAAVICDTAVAVFWFQA